MEYPCAKFGDFSFSRLGFIVPTDRQTDRQTCTHTYTLHIITDAAKRFSSETRRK